MSGHDDFAGEPIRGLPARLPKGEELRWQGAPDWKSLAVHGFHVRKVALYFVILLLWRIGVGIGEAQPARAIVLSSAVLCALGVAAIAVLSVLAFASARMAVYSITSERIVMRHGIAVPLTMNIPFGLIQRADLKTYADGTGDVSVRVPREHRVGFLVTWPHLRPGRILEPQPCFRALAEPRLAAAVLGEALAAHAGLAPVRFDARAVTIPAGIATHGVATA